ncbi:MAG: DUF4347 domain-containing protein, partial [bacterium]
MDSLCGSQSPGGLLFVDSSLLVDPLGIQGAWADDRQVVWLDPGADLLTQIDTTLAGMDANSVRDLGIFTHGTPGALRLGESLYGLEDLQARADVITGWGHALGDESDILIYGCNVGAGEPGQAFVQQLAALTGADVAASDDVTGSADLGGDFDLEVKIGEIDSDLDVSRLDFRGLLAATTTINASEADDVIELKQTGINAFDVTINSVLQSYSNVFDLTVDGLGGQDTIKLEFSGYTFGGGLTIRGGGGDDSLLLKGNLNMGSYALWAEAEAITSEATITASRVELLAHDEGAGSLVAGSNNNQTASISVSGSITATGAVVLSARVAQTIVAPSQSLNSFSGSSTASVAVSGNGMAIQGASVEIRAETDVQQELEASTDATGSMSLARSHITSANVSDGASVTATGGNTSLVAIDRSMVEATLSSPDVLGLDFGLLFANNSITRTTTAAFDGTGSSALGATGTVLVEARNEGGLSTSTLNDQVGTAINAATDTATARIAGAAIGSAIAPVAGLTLRSTNAGSFDAAAKVASNTLGGGSTATLSGSSVYSSGSTGIAVAASDTAEVSATSTPISFDVSTLTSAGSLATASARNDVNRATSAQVTGSTLNAANGDIAVTALSDRRLSATAHTVALSDSAPLVSNVALSLGGVYSENRVLGDVAARVQGGALTTTGGGDVRVSASDSSAIDAHTELSATAKTSGITLGAAGVSGGIAVAFNAIGWNASSLPGLAVPEQLLDALIGSNIGSRDTVDVEATLLDTTVSAAGDLVVAASSAPQVNATVSNAAETTASSLYGAVGGSASGILASNLSNSAARARLNRSAVGGANPDVTAGGSVTVTAQDAAGLFANSKIVSSSITTNDGGANVLNQVVAALEHDYTTEQGSIALAFGKRVLLADDYDKGGKAGRVYQFMGSGGNRDLSTEDYSNLDFWKEVLDTQLIPQGNNLTSSDAVAVGGIVVRNDARSEVLVEVTNASVRAVDGDITVQALEAATITTTADATATASGGSAYGTGTVIGASGIVATNLVLSDATVKILASELNAGDADAGDADALGNIVLDAANSARIDASVLNSVTSGDTAAGVTLAFNTVGWQAQNILFQAIDALISTDLGSQQPAAVRAQVIDSRLMADGDISVTAASDAVITADIGNEATSAAAALYGATGLAISALLASNMVSSLAEASIRCAGADAIVDVDAGGSVTVLASDNAVVDASSRMIAKGSTTNDGGASLINNFAGALLDEYRYTTNSATQTIKPFEKVRLASDYAGGTGAPGAVYEYTGTEASLNLGSQNYSSAPWRRLDPVNVVPAIGNISDSDSVAVGGMVMRNDVRGGVDASLTNAKVEAQAINVEALEEAQIVAFTLAAVEASGGSLFGSGTVIAGNGSATTNLVLSHADAQVLNSDLTASTGDIAVRAQDTSAIDATVLSSTTSGDTAIGVTLAFNSVGWESQNLLFNTLDALIGRPIGDFDHESSDVITVLD